MAGHRIDRTTEDIRRELTDIMRSLKDPRITGMLSIVRVELTNDLSLCKVYISSLEGFEAAKAAVKGLNNAAGFVRHEVCARVQMRRSPVFKFIADDSIEHSAQIAQMLHDIEEK